VRNRFIVVEKDFTTNVFDTLEEAQSAVTLSDDKCLIIAIENICEDGWPPFKLHFRLD
jgi:hypothetical protein